MRRHASDAWQACRLSCPRNSRGRPEFLPLGVLVMILIKAAVILNSALLNSPESVVASSATSLLDCHSC